MRCNKKVLMIATTAMLGVGCVGLMGAMKYQNVKTEASDLKESDVAKVGVDVSSESMEGETPSEGERKMDKEIIEKYNYKGYEISFIRYKDPKTGEYLSDKVKSRDYDYKKTFRDIIDKTENGNWKFMFECLKGKKDMITADIDWRIDNSKLVNEKYYGKLIRVWNIHFGIEDQDSPLNVAYFVTDVESGKYTHISMNSKIDWMLTSGNMSDKVKAEFKKYEKLCADKTKMNKCVKESVAKIKKQIKELYGINIVKEVKKDYYTHEYISNNLTTFGSITFNGKTDDGRKITVDYDVEGDYINNWDYKY